MKRLVFGKGLMNLVLRGEKKITLRKYRPRAHDFYIREIICGEFLDGLDILLFMTDNTKTKPFSELTNEEAREDGYENVEQAFNDLKINFYPDLSHSDTLTVIRFQVLQIHNSPVVSLNKHLK